MSEDQRLFRCGNYCRSGQLLSYRKHLVGLGANANVLGEVDPADGARGIDQKFGWTRDIGVLGASGCVQQIVAADDFRFRIGQEREGVTGLLAKLP